MALGCENAINSSVLVEAIEQDSCSGGFNMVADTHSEGAVCAGEEIVDLEECLCSCQNEESCSAVDWKYVLEIQNSSQFLTFYVIYRHFQENLVFLGWLIYSMCHIELRY